MKTSLKRWVGRVPDISAVLARFPVPVVLMGLFTLILIFKDDLWRYEEWGRLLIGLVIAAYACVIYVLAREAHEKPPNIILQILGSVAVAALAWYSKELRLNLPMAIGTVLLLLGNAVLWAKSRDDLHVWDFTHKIWTGAVFATVGSIIFFLGVMAIQAALKSLFGVNIRGLIEDIILPIGLGFLAPLYWLSTVPQVNEDYSELYDTPGFVSKAVAFLGTWLLAPLTLIYALILLAYGVKIILAGALPKGEIAALTTPFLIIGTLTWLVLDPPFVKDKVLAQLFRKSWFILCIPAAILLFIAVGVRIGIYGLTPERIALMLCAVWTIGLCALFTLGPKARRDIRIIPGFAAVLFGLGVFLTDNISAANQFARADQSLADAGILLPSGKIKAQEDINITNDAAAKRAKGALNYLMRNHPKSAWKRYMDEPFPKNENRYSNNARSEILERSGLNSIQPNMYEQLPILQYRNRETYIPSEDFTRIYGPYNLYRISRKGSDDRVLQSNDDFSFNIEKSDLVISHDKTPVSRFDLQTWAESLDVRDRNIELTDPDIPLFDQDNRLIVLKLKSLSLGKTDSENRTIQNAEFYILTKGY